MIYINFYFKNLSYNDNTIEGDFSSLDLDVRCKFVYNRKSEDVQIFDNNKPIEEITPLPIWWLKLKLKENGKLNESESKISY